MPSKEFGLVLGFHMPARKIWADSLPLSSRAVSRTCCSLSALQGPEMIRGPVNLNGQSLRGVISIEAGDSISLVHYPPLKNPPNYYDRILQTDKDGYD